MGSQLYYVSKGCFSTLLWVTYVSILKQLYADMSVFHDSQTSNEPVLHHPTMTCQERVLTGLWNQFKVVLAVWLELNLPEVHADITSRDYYRATQTDDVHPLTSNVQLTVFDRTRDVLPIVTWSLSTNQHSSLHHPQRRLCNHPWVWCNTNLVKFSEMKEVDIVW